MASNPQLKRVFRSLVCSPLVAPNYHWRKENYSSTHIIYESCDMYVAQLGAIRVNEAILLF